MCTSFNLFENPPLNKLLLLKADAKRFERFERFELVELFVWLNSGERSLRTLLFLRKERKIFARAACLEMSQIQITLANRKRD